MLSCLPTVDTDFRLLFAYVFFLVDSLAGIIIGSSSLYISIAEWRLLTLTSVETIDLRFGGVLCSLESLVEFMHCLRVCVSILWESDSWLLELLPSFLPCLISFCIASYWDYLSLFYNCFISSALWNHNIKLDSSQICCTLQNSLGRHVRRRHRVHQLWTLKHLWRIRFSSCSCYYPCLRWQFVYTDKFIIK